MEHVFSLLGRAAAHQHSCGGVNRRQSEAKPPAWNRTNNHLCCSASASRPVPGRCRVSARDKQDQRCGNQEGADHEQAHKGRRDVVRLAMEVTTRHLQRLLAKPQVVVKS